jgi:hypothetical protein
MHKSSEKRPVFNPWWPNSPAGHQFWMLVFAITSIASVILEYSQTKGYFDVASRIASALPGMIVAVISSAIGWYVVLVIVRFSAIWLIPPLRKGFDDKSFSPSANLANQDESYVSQVSIGSHLDRGSTRNTDELSGERNNNEPKKTEEKTSEAPSFFTPPSREEDAQEIEGAIKALPSNAENTIPSKQSVSTAGRNQNTNLAILFLNVLFIVLPILVVAWILGQPSPPDKKTDRNEAGSYFLTLLTNSPGFIDLSNGTTVRKWFDDSTFIAPQNCRLVGVYDSLACFLDGEKILFSVPLAFLGQADIAEMRRIDVDLNSMFSKQLWPWRIWTDASGGYRREMRIIGILGSVVAFEERNGTVRLVPFYELAGPDIDYIALSFPGSRSHTSSFLRKRNAR